MGAYLCGGLVLLPLLAAAPAGLAGRRRDLVSGLAAGAELLLAAALLAAGGSGPRPLPGLCGFGLALEWGGLRSLLALLAAVGWLAATLVSREYFSGSPEHLSRYTVFWLLTLSSVQGVFLSADLLTTFVFFELMSFLSYVLVVHTQKSHALRAGDTLRHKKIRGPGSNSGPAFSLSEGRYYRVSGFSWKNSRNNGSSSLEAQKSS